MDNRKDYYLPVTQKLIDNRGELVLPQLTVQHRLATNNEKEEHLRQGIMRTIGTLDTFQSQKFLEHNGLPIMNRNEFATFYLFDINDTRSW